MDGMSQFDGRADSRQEVGGGGVFGGCMCQRDKTDPDMSLPLSSNENPQKNKYSLKRGSPA